MNDGDKQRYLLILNKSFGVVVRNKMLFAIWDKIRHHPNVNFLKNMKV